MLGLGWAELGWAKLFGILGLGWAGLGSAVANWHS